MLNMTHVHDNNFVTHSQGFFLIVSYVNECDSKLVIKSDKLILHVLSELEVKCTKWLIK